MFEFRHRPAIDAKHGRVDTSWRRIAPSRREWREPQAIFAGGGTAFCFITLATDSSRQSVPRRVRCPAEMVGTISFSRNSTVRKMADE